MGFTAVFAPKLFFLFSSGSISHKQRNKKRLAIQDKADLLDYMGWLTSGIFMILLYFVSSALCSSHLNTNLLLFFPTLAAIIYHAKTIGSLWLPHSLGYTEGDCGKSKLSSSSELTSNLGFSHCTRLEGQILMSTGLLSLFAIRTKALRQTLTLHEEQSLLFSLKL